jgi:hypothetical protein
METSLGSRLKKAPEVFEDPPIITTLCEDLSLASLLDLL